MQNWFRVAFTYTSNAIEWNTLTLDEVKVLIEDGITIGWKTLRELKETKTSFNFEVDNENELIINYEEELRPESESPN